MVRKSSWNRLGQIFFDSKIPAPIDIWILKAFLVCSPQSPTTAVFQVRLICGAQWVSLRLSCNFRLNSPNDFIFSTHHNNMKTNIACDYGENPRWWRHFTSRTSYMQFLLKKCWRHQKIGIMGQWNLLFQMWPNNTFPTRRQPLSYNTRFTSYRIFSFCRILMTPLTPPVHLSNGLA